MVDIRNVRPVHWEVVLPNEEATGRLAMDLVATLAPGDIVALNGDLGAGKTTLARALVRALAEDDELEVPSPTFTLMQLYDLPRHRVVHADLYRLGEPEELEEIGWSDQTDGAVVLVEWPERGGEAMLGANRLDITISIPEQNPEHARRVRLLGHGRLAEALRRMRAIRALIDLAGFGPALRRHLQGDASSRTYERLIGAKRNAVLMNAPRRPDGPPVRGGRPYSQIAHLAEDVKPFVAMARGLKARGFSAPTIYAADLNEGLLVIEDLGDEGVLAGLPAAPVPERYEAAADVLAELHQLDLPSTLPVSPEIDHHLPAYDMEALLIEAELLLDWYLPHRGVPAAAPNSPMRGAFRALWSEALAGPLAQKPVWVLRDYHSPNLMWLPEREGTARVGLLDFQDAVMGPAAYDLVSLTQDARVDVPEELELSLLGRYIKARRLADPGFDMRGFAASYAVMGAQRATKILGIFARLNRRDGKPHYLRHIPRIWTYLERCLAFTELDALKAWFAAHVPPPEGTPGAEYIVEALRAQAHAHSQPPAAPAAAPVPAIEPTPAPEPKAEASADIAAAPAAEPEPSLPLDPDPVSGDIPAGDVPTEEIPGEDAAPNPASPPAAP
ncbi:tRNA (adenosine(37)-N6)-threonylcarbamoyltransferase complex ATPase subunit type 1 TsaE [Ancylobacter sp. G4_0304]|uniref:tRNA (adenosine(37)-N6)-threonylcarbamoyltransferase complex ATPase subunit type 1 TsaE n=1 Tax=Ancylobacter sp. G4_0304 TaxID=3114289 RepID=UPI0039C655C6